MPHLFAHSSRCLRSACSVRWWSSFLIILYSRQSSANKRTDELTQSGRSFIWHKNIIGQSTVPWGIPESTDVSFELSPSTIVLIVLVDRKLVSHEWMFPLMPYCSSLCRSLSCGTVSNALEKSRMAMSTCCPLSCSCKKSLIVVISWVSQEYPDLKPWFIFVRILFFSRCFRRCLQMMCSSILQVTDVSDTGL
jgi:hypothetical protein